MGAIFDAMVNFFIEDDWNYRQSDDSPILLLDFSGENGTWRCFAQAREDTEQFIFYSVCPIKAPENMRPHLMEFLTRANYGLVLGNFELDLEDGEIRYKTSIVANDFLLTPDMIEPVVYMNILTMDKYWPGIMAVLYGGVPAASAIFHIEGTS